MKRSPLRLPFTAAYRKILEHAAATTVLALIAVAVFMGLYEVGHHVWALPFQACAFLIALRAADEMRSGQR